MAQPGRLTRPPIKEALVDFRTDRAEVFDAAALKALWPEVQARFPHLEVRNKMQARFAPRLGRPPDAQAEDLGFYGLFLRPQDASRFAQFRVDGFAFSQLADYTTAEALFDEALELWQRFVELSKPDKVTRIALRYVNRLDLDFNEGDTLGRFLRASVSLPEDSPQVVSEFLNRAVMPLEANTLAIVTQRLEPRGPGDEHTPYVLDVDVFKTGDFPMGANELRVELKGLQEMKNNLFFSFLTDEALERYR